MSERKKPQNEILFAEPKKQTAYTQLKAYAVEEMQEVTKNLSFYERQNDSMKFFRQFQWVHTNDRHFWNAFEKAKQILQYKQNSLRSQTHLQAALVVGTSAMFSILPELQGLIDCVIMADNNLFPFEWMGKAESALRNRASKESYTKAMYSDSNPLYREARSQWELNRNTPFNQSLHLEDEMTILGEHHFLYSDQNYLRSRIALSQIPILHLPINLLSETDTISLTKHLAENDDTEIDLPLVNLTNIWMHVGARVQQSLSKLPIGDSVIMFSHGKGSQEPVEGFMQYLKAPPYTPGLL